MLSLISFFQRSATIGQKQETQEQVLSPKKEIEKATVDSSQPVVSVEPTPTHETANQTAVAASIPQVVSVGINQTPEALKTKKEIPIIKTPVAPPAPKKFVMPNHFSERARNIFAVANGAIFQHDQSKDTPDYLFLSAPSNACGKLKVGDQNYFCKKEIRYNIKLYADAKTQLFIEFKKHGEYLNFPIKPKQVFDPKIKEFLDSFKTKKDYTSTIEDDYGNTENFPTPMVDDDEAHATIIAKDFSEALAASLDSDSFPPAPEFDVNMQTSVLENSLKQTDSNTYNPFREGQHLNKNYQKTLNKTDSNHFNSIGEKEFKGAKNLGMFVPDVQNLYFFDQSDIKLPKKHLQQNNIPRPKK